MNNDMGLRISELLNALKIKKVRFAEQLGIDQSYVTQLTNGRRNPSDLLIGAICREFNVNEAWLRTGEGEMFAPEPDDTLGAFIRERNLTQTDRILIEKFVSLPVKSRLEVVKYMLTVTDAIWEQCKELAQRETVRAQTDADIEQDVAKQAVENFRYRSSLEKNPEAESSPSSEDGAETA